MVIFPATDEIIMWISEIFLKFSKLKNSHFKLTLKLTLFGCTVEAQNQ